MSNHIDDSYTTPEQLFAELDKLAEQLEVVETEEGITILDTPENNEISSRIVEIIDQVSAEDFEQYDGENADIILALLEDEEAEAEPTEADQEEENQLVLSDESVPDDYKEISGELEAVMASWSGQYEYEESGESWTEPATRSERRASRKRLKELRARATDYPDLLALIDDMEAVVEESDTSGLLPYHLPVLRSLIITALAIFGTLYFYAPMDVVIDVPEEWMVTAEDTWLLQERPFLEKTIADIALKTRVPAGTELKPMGRYGSDWYIMENSDGERGFVHEKSLAGYNEIVLASGTYFFEAPGERRPSAESESEMNATVLQTQSVPSSRNTELDVEYSQVRLQDGESAWIFTQVVQPQFAGLIPKINMTLSMPIGTGKLASFIGTHISEFEDIYFPALTYLKSSEGLVADFNYIDPFEEGKRYSGLHIHTNEAGIITSFEPMGDPESHWSYELPLVEQIVKHDLSNALKMEVYYKSDGWEPAFWTRFKDMNWFTWLLGWIIGFSIGALLIFLLFSIPRFLYAPFLNLVIYSRWLPNGMVVTLNLIGLLFFSYLFFLLMMLSMDGWATPLVLVSVAFIPYWRLHVRNIKYNRCPNCGTYGTSADEGSTHTGNREKSIHGTYDVYTGTTTNLEGNIRTRHYDRRSKVTNKVFATYNDHRQCTTCGHSWNVKREEEVSSKTSYH